MAIVEVIFHLELLLLLLVCSLAHACVIKDSWYSQTNGSKTKSLRHKGQRFFSKLLALLRSSQCCSFEKNGPPHFQMKDDTGDPSHVYKVCDKKIDCPN